MLTAKKTLCPGHLGREDQLLIGMDGVKATEARCALCGAGVEAVNKSGAWMLRKHTARVEAPAARFRTISQSRQAS